VDIGNLEQVPSYRPQVSNYPCITSVACCDLFVVRPHGGFTLFFLSPYVLSTCSFYKILAYLLVDLQSCLLKLYYLSLKFLAAS